MCGCGVGEVVLGLLGGWRALDVWALTTQLRRLQSGRLPRQEEIYK